MEPKNYTVSKIEGEYCYLKEIKTGDEIFIALALLPTNIDIGTKIHGEMFQYTVIE